MKYIVYTRNKHDTDYDVSVRNIRGIFNNRDSAENLKKNLNEKLRYSIAKIKDVYDENEF